MFPCRRPTGVALQSRDDEILTLARWACLIEEHYSRKRGRFTPMDMEWAKDGRTGELFILQARPETVQSQRSSQQLETYRLLEKRPVLVRGRSVGQKIATGPVRVVKEPADLHQVQAGDVLVTDKTDPDWEPTMKKAAAIVTNRGGRTCHAAIVSRELGLPAIVGTESGTDVLHDGQSVTVSCAEGETGFVYDGVARFEVQKVDLADHGAAEDQDHDERGQSRRSVAAVADSQRWRRSGPAGVHRHHLHQDPSAGAVASRVAFPRRIAQEIDRLTAGYADKPQFFVDKLAEGVAMIAAAFYPRDVIVRLCDFKTNEYANLIGGKPFEPVEENPMLGFRGASRYYHERYRDGFALECRAMKKVRDEMGLTNLKIDGALLPDGRRRPTRASTRWPDTGWSAARHGLEVYVMCEIPSNVILAEEFAEIFDGFSIGSNDLTQLTLGVDRDSEIVAPIFDERNPAVKSLIASVIHKAHAKGRKIGICGQAPSDYPEFARFLVEQGIDSISLNPDVVIGTTLDVVKLERALGSTTGDIKPLTQARITAS